MQDGSTYIIARWIFLACRLPIKRYSAIAKSKYLVVYVERKNKTMARKFEEMSRYIPPRLLDKLVVPNLVGWNVTSDEAISWI